MKRPLIALILVTLAACGGSDRFDVDGAREAIGDEISGLSSNAREDIVSAMRDACESEDLAGGVADMVTSDLPVEVVDVFTDACPAAADVLEDLDIDKLLGQNAACEAALRTIDVAIEAWYAVNDDNVHPASIDDLIAEGLVDPTSPANEYVDIDPGPPAMAITSADC